MSQSSAHGASTALILHPHREVLRFTCLPPLSDRLRSVWYTSSWRAPKPLSDLASATRDTALRDALGTFGIAKATVDYAGYGDSGDIESICLLDSAGRDVPVADRRIEIDHYTVRSRTRSLVDGGMPPGFSLEDARVQYRPGRYDKGVRPTTEEALRGLELGTLNTAVFDMVTVGYWVARTRSTETVESFLHDMALGIVGTVHGGWEINEGSQGTLTIDVSTGELHLDHGHNVMVVETDTETWDAPLPEHCVARASDAAPVGRVL